MLKPKDINSKDQDKCIKEIETQVKQLNDLLDRCASKGLNIKLTIKETIKYDLPHTVKELKINIYKWEI